MDELSAKLLATIDPATGAPAVTKVYARDEIYEDSGAIEIGPLGERFFRPRENFINFCVGSDQRGFLMGTINGNGGMPFVHVTVNELPIQTWQQIAVVKDTDGFHSFYQNGVLIHDDRNAASARNGIVDL